VNAVPLRELPEGRGHGGAAGLEPGLHVHVRFRVGGVHGVGGRAGNAGDRRSQAGADEECEARESSRLCHRI
jgi:hypothetical protein